ncbi:MAG: Methyltransferase type 11, partial [Actinomycetia bacterium]|nr:Methyltransferase type 11 [Actinomycetes bacterium]
MRRRFDVHRLDDEAYIVGAYHFLLGRDPDPDGLRTYVEHLRNGTRTRESMLAEMRGLDDWWLQRILNPEISLHLSRKLWVQQLPPARRILDLGGTDQQSADGALLALGYLYEFDLLAIVDLPPDERHRLYDVVHTGRVETKLGPVEYHHRSMTDLSVFEDGSFDLVFSGQSIEHVPEAEADVVLAEAHRVLRPGGHLYLDTPNGLACRLQLAGTDERVTNPNHDVEYTAAELRAKLEGAGFVIEVE